MTALSLTEKYTNQLRVEILKGKWNDPDTYITEKQLRKHFSVNDKVVLIKQRNKKKKNKNKSEKILFVRSPNILSFQTNDNEQEVLDATNAEAKWLKVKLEFCKIPLKILVKDLKGNNNDKIRGVVFQRFELVDQTQAMDKEAR